MRHRHPGGGHHARPGASDPRVHQPAEGEEVPVHRRPQQGPSPLHPQVRPLLLLLLLFSEGVVVFRQIDRLYDWKKSPDTDIVATLKKQKKNTKDEFDERAKAVIVEFAQQVSIITSSLINQSQRFSSLGADFTVRRRETKTK